MHVHACDDLDICWNKACAVMRQRSSENEDRCGNLAVIEHFQYEEAAEMPRLVRLQVQASLAPSSLYT